MYGVWNSMQKAFQFGINEPTPKKAQQKLFKKIGYDAMKWRFEIKKLPRKQQEQNKKDGGENG